MAEQRKPVPVVLEDEISLTDIIMRLWRRRGLILVLPMLAGIIGVIIVGTTAVSNSRTSVLYINLKGIDKSTYPNGVAFSANDLLIPAVIEELARKMKIDNTQSLAAALTVNFTAPQTRGIIQKFNAQLGQRGISATEIDSINKAFAEELQRATENTLRIALDHEALGLNAEQGSQAVTLLPQVWSAIYSRNFRVLEDTRLQGISYETDKDLTVVLSVFESQLALNNIRRGLEILSEDNRLKGLQTEDGVSPDDLLQQLTAFDAVYFSPIISNFLSSDEELAVYYLSDLFLQIEEINSQISNFDTIIKDLKTIQRTDFSAGSDTRQSTDALQINEGALNDIVALANQASLSTYLTKILDRKHELVVKRTGLQKQLNKTKLNARVPEPFVITASGKLNDLIGHYNALLKAGRQLIAQQTGKLYQPLGSSLVEGERLPPKAKLTVLLSIIIGGFLALVLALILPHQEKAKI